jgi:transposase
MEDWSGGASCLSKSRPKEGSMESLIVGVDVSKESFAAAGLDGKGTRCFTQDCAMDIDGFSKFLKTIMAQQPEVSTVIVGMESTGCYHINLFSYLTSQGIRAIVINPLLISNFAKLTLRKTKTDKKDALTIAHFLLAHKDKIFQMSVTQDMQDMRDLARERESLSHLISATKTEIKRVLQTTFPELERLCSVYTGIMLEFLREFPSARLIKLAKPKAIAKAMEPRGSGNRISTFTADDVIKLAKSSVGTVSPAKETILRGKISTLLHLEGRRDELTDMLTDYCSSLMVEDLEIVTSVEGISNGTGTTFLAELGRIENYETHKHLIAYAGIDPTVYQSGKYEGKSRISKRGNRHLRRVLWLMTVSVILNNDTFRAYYQKKKKAGLPYKKAVMATMHKLIRMLFAMLSHRQRYAASLENCA